MNDVIDISSIVVPKAAEAMLSKSRVTFVYGYRGGGKSTSIFTVALLRCLFEPHFRAAHCRQFYNEVKESTFLTLKECIISLGLEQYFTVLEGGMKIINKRNPSNFIFAASADRPGKIRSVPNLSCVIVDEGHTLREPDFSSLLGTMRHNLQKKSENKFIIIFNNDMVSSNGYIAKTFFNPDSPVYNDVERIHVSHRDNPFINQKETEADLLLTCYNNKQLLESLIAGAFMPEVNKTPFFHAIKETFGQEVVPFIPSLPIYVSVDFNHNPNSATLWQFVVNSGLRTAGNFVHCFREYQMLGSIETLLQHVRNDYHASVFYLTGDASGRKHDSGYNADDTLWRKAERALEIGVRQNISNARNSSHHHSYEACNRVIFELGDNFKVSKSCAMLIEDMKKAKTLTNDKGLIELYKNREQGYAMDLADTARYFIETAIYAKRQN
jgi:hypothetical protein